MSWLLSGIGVGVALLGVNVLTAAFSSSTAWRLPEKTAMLRREKVQRDAYDMLGGLRVWGMVPVDQMNSAEGGPLPPQWTAGVTKWSSDVMDLVRAGWGRMFVASFGPPYSTGGSGLPEFLRTLDNFIARCHTLRFRDDCQIDMDRWGICLGRDTAGDELF
ncbi:MAG: hypothetical protein ACYDHU_08195 [Acidimicrobiales bacterium]